MTVDDIKRNNTKPMKVLKTLQERTYLPPSVSDGFCFSYSYSIRYRSHVGWGLEDGCSPTTTSVVCLVFIPHSVRVSFGFVSDPRWRHWFVNAGDDIACVRICNLFWAVKRIQSRARTALCHLYTIRYPRTWTKSIDIDYNAYGHVCRI